MVENKRFSVSIRFWHFSDIFGYEGSIQPDIYLPKTIEDISANKDTQLKLAVVVLSGGVSKEEDYDTKDYNV